LHVIAIQTDFGSDKEAFDHEILRYVSDNKPNRTKL